jgi:hypothetical protein
MDRFAICQAFAQLESDFNVGGWVRERPSNQRRRESIGCQLHRMQFSMGMQWVDIEAEPDDADDYFDDEVRDIYIRHALQWGLPLDDGLKAVARRLFVADYLATFAQMAN